MQLKAFILVFVGLFSMVLAFAQDDSLLVKENRRQEEAPIEVIRQVPLNVSKLTFRKYFVPLQSLNHSVSYRPSSVYVARTVKYDHWSYQLVTSLNFNQTTFSDNWTAGGKSSLSIGTLVQGRADYNKDGNVYTSEIDLRYGRLWNKGQLFRKTNDRIFWDNRYSLLIKNHWSFFGSISFESQFGAGYKYGTDTLSGKEIATTVSHFFAPAYFTEAFGLEYKVEKMLSVRLGVLSARQTFVVASDPDISSTFGLARGQTFENNPACQLVVALDRELVKNVVAKARFAGLMKYKDMGQISDRLDLTLISKISSLISVSFTGVVLYDYDLNKEVQTTQVFEIGLLYKFPE